MKKILFLLLCLFCLEITLKAQVNIIVDSLANSLAQQLAGPGVIISNAKLTGGGYNNTGRFTAQNSNLDIKKGIVLSTGIVDEISGAYTDTSTTSHCLWCNYNDPDLKQLSQRGTANPLLKDVVILEFDVFVTADSLKFNYIFASEEYPDYVCTNYNDVFGFFISGPGISGPFSNNSRNIAIIPGTTIPVAINSINPGVKGINGNDNLCTSLNYTHLYRENTSTVNSITYNGFTTILTASAAVIPCNTYKLKLIIGDIGDSYFDSGVFIEAGSLVSSRVKVETSTSAGADYKNMVENCNDGIFKFIRNNADTSAMHIMLQYGGTATAGTDYTALPTQITIPARQNSVEINIHALKDGINEGTEKLVVYLLDPCFGQIIDSAYINIVDDIEINVSNDKTICSGIRTGIWASGAVNYSWTPAISLNDPFIKDPIAAPLTTTIYTVKAEVSNCVKYDSVIVNVLAAPVMNAISDSFICAGNNVQLFASGADTYAWTPSTGLSNPNIPDPVASPVITTTYLLTGTNNNGCSNSKEIIITVISPTITSSSDTIICEGNAASLNASGGTTYNWMPIAGLSDPNSRSTLASPLSTTMYSVTVTDNYGCLGIKEVLVEVKPPFNIALGNDTTICLGKGIALDAGEDSKSYKWSDGSTGKKLLLSQKGIYSVTVTGDYGCTATDTIEVETENCASKIFVPTAFSPNGDGNNDLLTLYETGGHTFKNIKIFNRWGKIVFESKDLHNSWQGDESIETGVYIFMLEYYDEYGEQMLSKGNITVLK